MDTSLAGASNSAIDFANWLINRKNVEKNHYPLMCLHIFLCTLTKS